MHNYKCCFSRNSEKFFFCIIAQFQIKNIYLREQIIKSSHNFMTLNKDSHQTILVKKLKNCIIISAALVEIQKKNFFRIIAQFQIKNIYLREQTNKSSHNFMTLTLNKDSHQTILVKKLKNCIIISAALVEIRKKNFFRIIAQFQIKNIYLREQTNKSSHNFMTLTLNKDSHQTILVKKLKNCIIISAALVEIRKKNFFSHNCTISNQKYILT